MQISEEVLAVLQQQIEYSAKHKGVALDKACPACTSEQLAVAEWKNGTVDNGVRRRIFEAKIICSGCRATHETGQTFGIIG